MKNSAEIDRILARTGLVARKQHPDLTGTIDWLAGTGRLQPVLPGVYAAGDAPVSDQLRLRAVMLRHPDAVLLEGAAARQTFWPDAPMPTVVTATRGSVGDRPGFSFIRRQIPPELIVERNGLRFSSPALTAIDLASFADAEPIDRVLRSRMTRLPDLHEALRLTPNRPRNPERLRLLVDSRDSPWSEAERRSHRILRRAGIRGWEANLPVSVNSQLYYLDIAFKRQLVALEIDGRIHEDDEDLFESDRRRQNALIMAGWIVLRYTWKMLLEQPEVLIADVLAALRRRNRQQSA